MAAVRTRGCKGVVYAKERGASGAPTRVFGVSAWGTAEAADEQEASEIGECEKVFIPGSVETNMTLNLWWDPLAPANQAPLQPAEEIDIEVYPGGATAGQTKYANPTGGAAIVLGRDLSGSTEGAVAGVYNIKVNGRLVSSVVT